MWIFRYFLPGVFALALGIFVAQNVDQKVTIEFLFWRFYGVHFVLPFAVAFVTGVIIPYYIIFVKWMGKQQLKWATQKIMKARKDEEDFKLKKGYSEDIERVAEERMKNRIENEKTGENKKET
jgi:uncharacterized integral membrane protein